MLDTGANISVVSEAFLKRNELNNKIELTKRTITLANGDNSSVIGIIK